MGRLIVVVLVIAVLAFLANKFLLQGGDPPPPGALDPPAEAEAEEPSATQTTPEQTAAASTADDTEPVAQAAPAEDDIRPGSADASSPPADIQPVTEPETVQLGAADLTAGIEGDGDLSLDEVKAWISEPRNHVVLKPELPLGLAAGASQIAGLEENPLTRAKIELGRQLFFDPRISSDNTVSCASCHHPDFGYGKDTQFGVGVDGQEGGRNSPVAYNRLLSTLQFWDGRAGTLEEQAKGPVENPIEMANTFDVVIADLKSVPHYVAQFEAVFGDGEGDDAVDKENFARAVAAFERTLVTGPTPWDHYKELDNFETQFAADIEDLEALAEEDPELHAEYMELKERAAKNQLSESARRGGELFFSDKAGCTQCHVGANFTDEKYHNLGVGMEADEPDLGRFVVTNDEKERGAFKTPTVRNVASTGPYMHDGSQKTLMEVVEWYDKGGHKNDWLSDKIKPLKLTDEEKQDLVNFMQEGLQGELPQVEQGRLPPAPNKVDAVATK